MVITGNRVKVLEDGRVEITLLIPLPLFRYKRWVKFYTHGSELIIEGDKITGIRCHPKLWEETLKTLAPGLLEHFRKIVGERIRKIREKSKGPYRILRAQKYSTLRHRTFLNLQYYVK